jgi:hypothetical protein
MQRVPVAHGGTTRQVSEPKILDTKMRDFSVNATVHLNWYRETDVEEFAGFLWEFCEAFNSQTKKYLFETVGKTSEAVGNVIDGKGMDIWDAQIEMLKQTEMRFDEDGNHGTTFYMHPDTAKKMQKPPTPEQTKRWNETMQAKKEEYYAKKRTRRLS